MNNDLTDNLQEQVKTALNEKTALQISAGNSKLFYGNTVDAKSISLKEHSGIIEYQPSELVVTVRSGTLLSELEAELKANKQILAFEPPRHDKNSTIGGIIACGLSGPRRAASGSARDFVLGTNIINGKAEKCRFGGQVMKNVAGYDASRLMTGAQGTLGILLDISLKVLPTAEEEISVHIQADQKTSISSVKRWVKQGLPISASCHYKDTLYIRFSSTASAVKQSLHLINEQFSYQKMDNTFWESIKNQSHDFFNKNRMPLWRYSHANAAELFKDSDDKLIEWNGALCWTRSVENLHQHAEENQANATLYTSDNKSKNIFQPLQPGIFKIHQRLKQAFDPEHILNPGRLYSEL